MSTCELKYIGIIQEEGAVREVIYDDGKLLGCALHKRILTITSIYALLIMILMVILVPFYEYDF